MRDWQSEVRARLKPLDLKPEREADIVDEIAQHLAERYREAVSGGATAEEATRMALAEFRAGNVLAKRIAALKQAHAPAAVTLGASTGHLLADVWHDLRYAARAFAKHRAFAATAVLLIGAVLLVLGLAVSAFGVWRFRTVALHISACRRPRNGPAPSDAAPWSGGEPDESSAEGDAANSGPRK